MENEAAAAGWTMAGGNFREKKDVELSDGSDSDSGDSYESLSLGCSDADDIVDVNSEDGEDGEIVGASSDIEDDNPNRQQPQKRLHQSQQKPKRSTIWSDVVCDQVLSSSLGQLNQGPITFAKFERSSTNNNCSQQQDGGELNDNNNNKPKSRAGKKKKNRNKSSSRNSEQVDPNRPNLPPQLLNYHDLDAENEVLASKSALFHGGSNGRSSSSALHSVAPSSGSASNGVDFNALIKAVERSRAEKEVASHSKQTVQKLQRKSISSRLGPPVATQSTRPGSGQDKAATSSAAANNGKRKHPSQDRRKSSEQSRVQIDESVVVTEDLTQPELVNALSRALGESQSVETLTNCVSVLGSSRCVDFFQRTLAKEQSGGLTILDGSRRKTPGGVFFYLVKTSANVTAEERCRVFTGIDSKSKSKKRRKNNRSSSRRRNNKTASSSGSGPVEPAEGENSNSIEVDNDPDADDDPDSMQS